MANTRSGSSTKDCGRRSMHPPTYSASWSLLAAGIPAGGPTHGISLVPIGLMHACAPYFFLGIAAWTSTPSLLGFVYVLSLTTGMQTVIPVNTSHARRFTYNPTLF